MKLHRFTRIVVVAALACAVGAGWFPKRALTTAGRPSR